MELISSAWNGQQLLMPGFLTTICSDEQKVYIPRDVHESEIPPLEEIIVMTSTEVGQRVVMLSCIM